MQKLKFPKNFLWGAASAAYQVEGNIENDWEAWARSKSTELAKHSEKNYRDQVAMIGNHNKEAWERIRNEAGNPDNYVARIGANHYENFKEDFKIAKSLGHNAHRFSIEWARIEPEMGKFDENAIAHYREVLRELKNLGLEPLVTLWHFTSPKWFADLGSFEKSENIKYFEIYVKKIVDSLGSEFTYWLTINEPVNYTLAAYVSGDFPPSKQIGLGFFRIIRNFIKAHKAAYKIIKESFPNSKVSIALHTTDINIHPSAYIVYPLIKLYDYLFNDWFVSATKNELDFLGLNFYVRIDINLYKVIKALKIILFKNFNEEIKGIEMNDKEIMGLSDMGWYLYPKGIYVRLKHYWNKFKLPLIITEHGLADAEDKYRAEYIQKSLEYVEKAISEGVDVQGYMHWSLTDNYEWDKGFWPRFGLVEINYKTGERKIRKSAFEYKKIIEQSNT